jgi:hypothetical protein
MRFFNTWVNNIISPIRNEMPRFGPYLLISLGPILLLAYPILMGKSLFWGIPALQFVPWRVYAFDQILQGRLPFLNEYNGMVAPLLANYQLALFYPFTWISFPFYIFGDAPLLAWSNNFVLLIHLILSGVGMGKLIKQWHGTRIGMIVGGLAFCLCGYWACRLGFFSIVWAGAWLPWEMYLVNKLLEHKKNSGNSISIYTQLVVVVALQLLAGHAQITWYSLGMISIWVVASIAFRRDISRPIFKLILYGTCVLLAAAVSSIQLFPTVEFLLQSQRSANVDYATALGYSFWPWHLINFIMPNFFGSPSDGNYWGYVSYWEDAVYLGIFPLMSAGSTFVMLIRPGQKLQESAFLGKYKFIALFGWISIVVGILLAFGYNTPAFPFLFKYVPTFDMFNAPTRIMVIVVFFLSWLAGLGISFWEKPRGKQKIWIKRLIVAGFAFILGVIISKIMIPWIKPTILVPGILFGASISLAFWLILKIQYPEQNKRWEEFVFIFVLIDLLIPTIQFTPYIDNQFYQRNLNPSSQYNGRVFIDSRNEYVLKFSKFLRFTNFSAPGDWSRMRAALLPNINILDGIDSASNFDPLLVGRFQSWLDRYNLANNTQKQNMLTDMDVKTLLLTNLRGSDDGVSRINRPHAGLIQWAGCIATAATPEKALEMTIGNSNPGIAILEGSPARFTGKDNGDCENKKAAIEINKTAVDSVIASVTTDSPGLLWISYLNYPGWKITIDKAPVHLEKVNYLFMGAEVTPGKHLIEFNFQPESFYWGMVVSIMGCCVLIMLKLIQKLKTDH